MDSFVKVCERRIAQIFAFRLLDAMKNFSLRSKIIALTSVVVVSFYVSAGGEDRQQSTSGKKQLNAQQGGEKQQQTPASTVSGTTDNISNDGTLSAIRQLAKTYQQQLNEVQQQREESVTSLNTANLAAEKIYLDLDKKQADLVIFNQKLEEDKLALSFSLENDPKNAQQLFASIQKNIATRNQNLSSLEKLKSEQNLAKDNADQQLEALLKLDHKINALQIDTKKAVGELAKEHFSQAKAFTFTGTVRCQTGEALKQCMNKASTRDDVVDLAVKHYFKGYESNGSNWDSLDYKLLELEYLNVTQDWHGTTQFKAKTKLMINVNNRLLNSLYAFVGLPENYKVSLVLRSNQYATFYIDGKEIGKGVNKVVWIDQGDYTFKAEYQGKVESSKEHISSNKTLFYKL